MKKAVNVFIFLSLFTSQAFSATTYYSRANGNWSLTSTWSTSCGGASAGVIPTTGDNVVICDGNVVTVNSGQSINKITIDAGGFLTLEGTDSYTLAVTDITTINGTFELSGNSIFETSSSFRLFGTMNMTGGYLHLTLDAGGNDLSVDGVFNQSGGLVEVAHFVHIQNGGIYNLSGASSVFKLNNTLRLRNTKGTLNIEDGTIYFKGEVKSETALDEINQRGGIIQFENSNDWLMTGKYTASAGSAIFEGTTVLRYSGTEASWTFFDLQINNSGEFDQNSVVNINVKRDWINKGGTYIHEGQRVTFNGDIAQSIGGADSTLFDSLTINNTSTTGVTLSQPVTISTVLSLTDGYVYTDATNLMIVRNNASAESGSSESFISGPMKKIGNDPFAFPIGYAGATKIWARLEMVDDDDFRYFNAATEFTCEYFSAGAPNGSSLPETIDHVSYAEYWDLDRVYDVANNAQCNVRLYWEDASYSGITDTDSLIIAHYNGTIYENLGGDISGSSIVTTSPLTSFSPFTFGSIGIGPGINPLPIELLDFTVAKSGTQVTIAWSTASEINNDYFTIERSTNGIDFSPTHTTNGAGTSLSSQNYSSIDYSPYNGVSYYRLKQTDFDGEYSYSKIQSIRFNKDDAFSFIVYAANDVEKKYFLKFTTVQKRQASVTIYNLGGTQAFKQENIRLQNGEMVELSLHELKAGIYIISVSNNENTYFQKLILP